MFAIVSSTSGVAENPPADITSQVSGSPWKPPLELLLPERQNRVGSCLWRQEARARIGRGPRPAKRSHSGAAAAPANVRGDAPGLARGTERHGLASRTPHFCKGAALYLAAMRPAHPHPAPREPTP
jgi:hypothetical protein